jgi:hypothetical protein
MRRSSFVVATLALLAIAVPGAMATKAHHRHRGHKAAHNDTSPGNSGEHKTTICHATGSETNPYVLITVDNHALKAHREHQDGRDIIPAPRDASGKPFCPTPPPPATTPPPTTTPTTPPATTAPTTGSSPTVSAPAGEVKGEKVTSKKKKKAKRRARKPRRASGFTG